MSDQLFPGMMNGVQDQTELSNYAKLAAQSQALRRRFESPNQDKAKLREATQDFEAIFIGKLWEQMRNTVPKEGYLHSKQEDFYLSMFDQELSRKLAGAGGIGIGDMLYEQLKTQLVEKSKSATPGAPVEIKPLPEVEQAKLKTRSEPSAPVAEQGAADPAVLPRDEIFRRIDHLALEIESQARLETEQAKSAGFPLPHIDWPIEGRTVSQFGFAAPTNRLPSGSRGGVEIAAPALSSVSACLEGVVTAVERRPDLGLVVEIEHGDGLRSVYGHLENVQVSQGQRVTAGREIAQLAPEYGKNVPRLYFEVRQGNIALNPELLRTA